MIACICLAISACSLDQAGTAVSSGNKTSESASPDTAQALENRELRAQIRETMSKNSVVSRKNAWNVLADGASTSDSYMTLFYTRRIVLKTDKASGENQSQPDYWNREHLWPRSFGLKGNSADYDLHNLVPTDRTVNSSRGNKVFGTASSPHHECNLCRVSSYAWEPPDEVKGDIARVLFYMDIRYDGLQEGDTESESPHLSLVEIPNASEARFGPLDTLLAWHCEDKVSDAERMRQKVIFDIQGNRNVFVDEPELVEAVYGFNCDGGLVVTKTVLN